MPFDILHCIHPFIEESHVINIAETSLVCDKKGVKLFYERQDGLSQTDRRFAKRPGRNKYGIVHVHIVSKNRLQVFELGNANDPIGGFSSICARKACDDIPFIFRKNSCKAENGGRS